MVTSRPASSKSKKSSRPSTGRSSWLDVETSSNAFKLYSVDQSIKKLDANIEKESEFIKELEEKIINRDELKKLSSELLNKRWNDNVYFPIMNSIHETVDKNCNTYSKKLQQQYAHYRSSFFKKTV